MIMEEIIIFVILLTLISIFREELAGFFINIMYKIAPDAASELTVSGVAHRIEIFMYIIFAIMVLLILACFILLWIGDIRAKMREDVEWKEYEQRKAAFLSEFPISKKIFASVEDVIVLEHPVEENYYLHTGVCKDNSKWGVYVGKFFLRCDCTARTYKVVESLRQAGVPIKSDTSCIYEEC